MADRDENDDLTIVAGTNPDSPLTRVNNFNIACMPDGNMTVVLDSMSPDQYRGMADMLSKPQQPGTIGSLAQGAMYANPRFVRSTGLINPDGSIEVPDSLKKLADLYGARARGESDNAGASSNDENLLRNVRRQAESVCRPGM